MLKKIDKKTFVVPALLSVVILIIGVFFPEGFGKFVNMLFSFVTGYLGWIFQYGLVILLIICLWAAFSKYGRIRLGGKDAKPTMSFLSWCAITFTSGMALGVVFYGVGEGLMNYMSPPGFSGDAAASAEAAEHALSYVFFHWGFQPYAIYTAAGLGYAFVYWNTKRSFNLSSSLYPLMGEKGEKGWAGNLINWVSMYIMMACLGTNIGLGALQLTSGIEYVSGSKVSGDWLPTLIIIILATSGITCACSGIHKAIKHVSNLNMIIFFILMFSALVLGGTKFILNNVCSSIGEYLKNIVWESFYLEPAKQSGWIADWTLYYWNWWLLVGPITGLFLTKLAKGRTIKEFVLVNMFIPVGFVIAWFGIFGSSAIFQQMNGHDIWGVIQEYGFPVAQFAYLKTLPGSGFLIVLGFLATFFSFVTQSESMTYTMAGMTSADKSETATGEQNSPAFLKIFWGVAIAVMGYVLLKAGGLQVVQRATVMMGLPILIILMINIWSFIKAVRHREIYDNTLTDEEKEMLKRKKEEEANELF